MLFGRMIPAVRGVISIPAGIAHMPIGRFLLFSALGNAIWTALLMTAGHQLGSNYGEVSRWLTPASQLVVSAIIIAYLWRLIRFNRR